MLRVAEHSLKHDDVCFKCSIFCLHILNRFGVTLGNRYGGGTGQIWLDEVACTGSETHIFNCSHRGWGRHNCRHHEDVSISCRNSTSTNGNAQNNTKCVYFCFWSSLFYGVLSYDRAVSALIRRLLDISIATGLNYGRA